jgi:hypothetical protein
MPAPMASLTDPFSTTSLNTGLWAPFTAGSGSQVLATTSGLECQVIAGVGGTVDAGVSSQASYDLTGSYLAVNAASVGQAAYGGTTCQAFLLAATTAGPGVTSSVKFALSEGVLYMGTWGTNYASPAWNAAAMAWWRIRETAGTVYFETSPDGAAWTVQGATATSGLGFAVTALYATLYAAKYSGNSFAQTAYWLSLNPVTGISVPAGLASAAGTALAPYAQEIAVGKGYPDPATAAGTAQPPAVVLAAYARAGLATAAGTAHPAAGSAYQAPVQGKSQSAVSAVASCVSSVSPGGGSCKPEVYGTVIPAGVGEAVAAGPR